MSDEQKERSLHIKNLAKEIYKSLGGSDNLVSIRGNISRMKIVLSEPSKFDYNSLVAQYPEDLLGALNRLDNENAIYLVTKPDLGEPLGREINFLKGQKATS